MVNIKWHDTFETGIEFIDNDHRRLIGIIQEIQKAHKTADLAGCRSTVVEFLEQVKAHFRREEEFLEAIRFPDLVTHANRHRQLTARVEQLLASMAPDPDSGLLPDLDHELIEDALFFLLEDVIKADAEFKTMGP